MSLPKRPSLRVNSAEISIKEILEQLLRTHQLSAPNYTITAQLDDVRLPGKQGTALALIASELLANAIKHGKSKVHLSVQADSNRKLLDLCVSDDGPGFAVAFDPMQAANTGLELILNLARWDLKGELCFGNHAEGGEVHLRMPFSRQAEFG